MPLLLRRGGPPARFSAAETVRDARIAGQGSGSLAFYATMYNPASVVPIHLRIRRKGSLPRGTYFEGVSAQREIIGATRDITVVP